jgi:hypothetical protein
MQAARAVITADFWAVVNAINPALHDGDRITAEKAVHGAGFQRLEGGERRALVDVIVGADIATRDTRAVAAAVLGAGWARAADVQHDATRSEMIAEVLTEALASSE